MRIASMFGVVDLPTYVTALAVVILLPGPNSLLVLATASRSGVRSGYAAAAGVWTGDLLLMMMAVGGVASLLQARPTLFAVLQMAGAGYLAWMGCGLIRTAVSQWRRSDSASPAGDGTASEPRPGTSGHAVSAWVAYRRSLAVSLVNPKAIIFFVAFFVQFVDPSYPRPWLSFLLLGTLVQMASVLYLSLVIVSGHRLASLFRQRRGLAAGASAGAGALFLWFAVSLGAAAAA